MLGAVGVAVAVYLFLAGSIQLLPHFRAPAAREESEGIWPRKRQFEALRQRLGRLARRKEEEGFEQGLLAIAESLRAGESLTQALLRAAGGDSLFSRRLQSAILRYEQGRPLMDALELSFQQGGLESRLFLHAIALHRETGANLIPIFGTLAESVIEARALVEGVATKTTEARWTARILAVTPLAFLVLFLLLAPEMLAPLVGTPVGRISLVYAGASWAVGVLLTSRLLRKTLPTGGEGIG